MPNTDWTIAEAKGKLSELLDRADRKAQVINRRGTRYVLIRDERYQELIGKSPSLKELILNGPSLRGVDLERS